MKCYKFSVKWYIIIFFQTISPFKVVKWFRSQKYSSSDEAAGEFVTPLVSLDFKPGPITTGVLQISHFLTDKKWIGWEGHAQMLFESR